MICLHSQEVNSGLLNKTNILSVTPFFFLPQLIISLVAILRESLSTALAHSTAINHTA